jgi:hypothetical protein
MASAKQYMSKQWYKEATSANSNSMSIGRDGKTWG